MKDIEERMRARVQSFVDDITALARAAAEDLVLAAMAPGQADIPLQEPDAAVAPAPVKRRRRARRRAEVRALSGDDGRADTGPTSPDLGGDGQGPSQFDWQQLALPMAAAVASAESNDVVAATSDTQTDAATSEAQTGAAPDAEPPVPKAEPPAPDPEPPAPDPEPTEANRPSASRPPIQSRAGVVVVPVSTPTDPTGAPT
ncbi:hypothetical protein [Haliangium sp.]|uniref:hypothetical protein n=1 Tax=Haliangium sp. TaxID=2663208 RepID=UPI003D0E803C